MDCTNIFVAYLTSHVRCQYQFTLPGPVERVTDTNCDDLYDADNQHCSSDLRKLALNLIPFPRVGSETNHILLSLT